MILISSLATVENFFCGKYILEHGGYVEHGDMDGLKNCA